MKIKKLSEEIDIDPFKDEFDEEDWNEQEVILRQIEWNNIKGGGKVSMVGDVRIGYFKPIKRGFSKISNYEVIVGFGDDEVGGMYKIRNYRNNGKYTNENECMEAIVWWWNEFIKRITI